MSDIYEEAENAVETKPEYSTWGECLMDMFEAVWPKGAKAPERFDPSVHQPNDRFIRCEIMIIPLDEMQAKFSVEWKGNVTGWNNRDWTAATLPSIKALNIPLKDINHKYVKITRKPNGKFYEKKVAGVGTGEKKELTDFFFVKVFANEADCLADFLARSGEPTTAASDADFPASVPAQTPQMVTDAVLLKFASAIVASAAKNTNKDVMATTELVNSQIDKNPMFAGKITSGSPEILEMIMAACA
jgi:hypothetical protein